MMALAKKLNAMRRRYARLKARLNRAGFLLQGTITNRTILRPDPDRPGEKRPYGPYYQWTWKRQGKTVTVNLSPSQAPVYQEAIRNNRALEKTLHEMRVLSLRILEATTTGVKKRRRRRENGSAL